mmetsp:Transcript_34313/g.99660  ORF Transcript_34313/g.99660 Transcript_34313/m.99660 type:complete len:264 (-) Transcript_34313:164-955(-)
MMHLHGGLVLLARRGENGASLELPVAGGRQGVNGGLQGRLLRGLAGLTLGELLLEGSNSAVDLLRDLVDDHGVKGAPGADGLPKSRGHGRGHALVRAELHKHRGQSVDKLSVLRRVLNPLGQRHEVIRPRLLQACLLRSCAAQRHHVGVQVALGFLNRRLGRAEDSCGLREHDLLGLHVGFLARHLLGCTIFHSVLLLGRGIAAGDLRLRLLQRLHQLGLVAGEEFLGHRDDALLILVALGPRRDQGHRQHLLQHLHDAARRL